MKRFLIAITSIFFGMAIGNSAYAACSANQIDVLGDGTQCETAHFSITTTSDIANNGTFLFSLSAQGTFYVDCGENGSLSGTGVTTGSKIIDRTSSTTNVTYTCTYASAGPKTIRFGGTATNYNSSTMTAAISFYKASGGTQAKIASISGNLSAMFPFGFTGAKPRFYQTFQYATNLTSIPDTLFENYTKVATYMFSYTFYGCTGLTDIPENLFFPKAQSVTGQTYMFESTFADCTGLTSIPANLFSKVTKSAQRMFESTFSGCRGLTSIPANLFSRVTTSEPYMFVGTFAGCTGLTSIPENLFFPNAQSVTGANSMFYHTFGGCTGLTSIPANLFSKVTTSASSMFQSTFDGCANISGNIPRSTFAGLIDAGSPTANDMWYDTFKNTQLSDTCSTGTEVETTYKGTTSGTQWGNYAMCEAGSSPRAAANIPTSQSYVDAGVGGLQNKFAGSGANKLMTYPSDAGGTPGSRDIVTTLGTPNATTGIYSNTTDTTIPTTGAVYAGIDAKQDVISGTPGYAMTETGVDGVVGSKAIYGNTTQFTNALVEVGTVNSAIVDAVNSELTQVDENGSPSATGLFWRVNSVANIVTLPVSGN